jgi:hypothetical protein
VFRIAGAAVELSCSLHDLIRLGALLMVTLLMAGLFVLWCWLVCSSDFALD